MSKFVHLHLHTHYSLLDGLGKPEEIMKRVQDNKQEAVAITDHGAMYGCIDFYKAAKSHDLKPLIGCEVYIARHGHLQKRPGIDVRPYHLTLLARDNQGYENLLKLTTIAHLKGFYYKPRIDMELLKEYGKGLIGLSGCINGNIPQALLSGNMEEAKNLLKMYQSIFGKENFYLEVQDHPENPEQMTLNTLILKMGLDEKVQVVATNDCHYVHADDHDAHDTLICIQTNSLLSDTNRMRYDGDFSIRSTEDMIGAFRDNPEVLSNTVEIAKQCDVKFDFGKYLIPAFDVPKKKDPETFLRELVMEGLKERYGKKADEKEIFERADFELKTIHSMGFDTYFLIVWDLVKYARDNGIVVGPGRGSAAGSIVSYCLKITDIDPLKYDLLFERFLNPERISMPDIDIDFADDRRDEVLQYVSEKYGKDHVAQIITFGTMAAKAAVKDVGRVQGIGYQKMNNLSKMIPLKPGTKLADALESEADLKKAYDTDPETKAIMDTALKLEGTIRHAGVHACAVVIAEKPLVNYTALQNAPGDAKDIITQYSMKPLEMLGLLKMDFLGLKNLTIIHKCLEGVERRHGKKINLHEIPADDAKTFALLANGETTGVFQFESPGMKRYLKDLKPTQFEDLIAMVSLYRPGPMQFIPEYIAGKHGKKVVEYVHKDLANILEKTYGIAVYQEQILQIAQKFAGFSLGEADILRRAIGKKIASELKSQREKFITGGEKLGYTKKLATEIFDNVIEPFADYGFNKSHAACYAMIALQTGYLKAHFPAEFMAALLTAEQSNSDRVAVNIEECTRMGIKILPPHINESLRDFTVIDNQTIRFGLAAIKNLGHDTIEQILKERNEHGNFKDLTDFAKRLQQKYINKKSVEALAKSGALDDMEERKTIIDSISLITDFAKHTDKQEDTGQIDIFGAMDSADDGRILSLKKTEPATQSQKLMWEKEILGLYVSSHPLKGLKNYLKLKVKLISSITVKSADKSFKIAGLVNNVKKITTKRGDQMMAFSLEDMTGSIQVTVFPKTFKEYADKKIFEEDNFLVLGGRLDMRNNEMNFICAAAKKVSIETMKQNAIDAGLYDENETNEPVEAAPDEPVSEDDKVGPPSNGVIDVTEQILAAAAPHDGKILKLKKTLTKSQLKEVSDIIRSHPGDDEITLEVFIDGNAKQIPIKDRVKVSELKKAMKEFLA